MRFKHPHEFDARKRKRAKWLSALGVGLLSGLLLLDNYYSPNLQSLHRTRNASHTQTAQTTIQESKAFKDTSNYVTIALDFSSLSPILDSTKTNPFLLNSETDKSLKEENESLNSKTDDSLINVKKPIKEIDKPLKKIQLSTVKQLQDTINVLYKDIQSKFKLETGISTNPFDIDTITFTTYKQDVYLLNELAKQRDHLKTSSIGNKEVVLPSSRVTITLPELSSRTISLEELTSSNNLKKNPSHLISDSTSVDKTVHSVISSALGLQNNSIISSFSPTKGLVWSLDSISDEALQINKDDSYFNKFAKDYMRKEKFEGEHFVSDSAIYTDLKKLVYTYNNVDVLEQNRMLKSGTDSTIGYSSRGVKAAILAVKSQGQAVHYNRNLIEDMASFTKQIADIYSSTPRNIITKVVRERTGYDMSQGKVYDLVKDYLRSYARNNHSFVRNRPSPVSAHKLKRFRPIDKARLSKKLVSRVLARDTADTK